MNTQETIFCYYCKKTFYVDGYRLREAKTISCLYCKKRIDKKKAKIEGEKRCSNCNAMQEDHIDFQNNSKSGDTCPYRKSMKFLEKEDSEMICSSECKIK